MTQLLVVTRPKKVQKNKIICLKVSTLSECFLQAKACYVTCCMRNDSNSLSSLVRSRCSSCSLFSQAAWS